MCIALALVLLAAAMGKGYDLARGVPGDGSIMSTFIARTVLVIAEWAGAMWLLSGMHLRRTAIAAAVLFSLFAAYSFMKAITGAASCGCFGAVAVPPWWTFGMDVAAVTAVVVTLPRTGTRAPSPRFGARMWLLLTACGALILGATIVALSSSEAEADGMGSPGALVVLEPETWTGKPLALARHIATDVELTQGSWLLVLYRADCAACRQHLPIVEAQARGGRQVLLVQVPPVASPMHDPVPMDTRCRRGALRADREWFVQTPVELEIENGVVMRVRRGAEH